MRKAYVLDSLGQSCSRVPTPEQLFVLMDANARTGRRGGGESKGESIKALGAYSLDKINDNGER